MERILWLNYFLKYRTDITVVLLVTTKVKLSAFSATKKLKTVSTIVGMHPHRKLVVLFYIRTFIRSGISEH